MRPDESFVGQSVRSLQTMLRVIAENDDTLPSVIPDGFYGQDTRGAVSSFQRRYSLPETGITDQATWDTVVQVYQQALVEVAEAEALNIVLNPGEILHRGSQDPNVYVLQAVLTVLSQMYGSIPLPGFSGVLDIPTSNSLIAFQQLNFLPATGELDKQTWRHLALHYPGATVYLRNNRQ